MSTPKELLVQQVKITELNPALYNPRKWSDEATANLRESISRFGLVDPIIVNGAEDRQNIVIGGHFRLKVARDMGFTEVPVVYVHLPEAKEKELNLRLNKNVGEWDFNLLAEFDESLLVDVGFTSEELDDIFTLDDEAGEEIFDLQKELEKLDIAEVTVQKGDVYQLGDSRLMCGDSTIGDDFGLLMNGERAALCLTDPPYLLDYVHAKRGGNPTTTHGPKKNRRYLETETLPDNFSDLWMANVAAYAADDFSIICYESWKNLRTIWAAMEKHWTVKNMIIWHLANRHEGYSSRHQFFNKYDIAMVGAKGIVQYNENEELDGLQEEYQTALYAITGNPQWEDYKGSKKRQLPTDFIEFEADDKKHSGQGIIFGTKPVEILIPYIKVLTKRGDLIVEPFCGSGSTLIAATKLNRRCYIMEKVPAYAEVAIARWEKLTGQTRVKIESNDDGSERT